MPVEIREIIIRTEISSFKKDGSERELELMKKKLLEECRKIIVGANLKKRNIKR